MRLFVTGATGFVGSAVVRQAVDQGHVVAALIRPGKMPPAFAPPGVRWVVGTLAEADWEAIANFRPETCIHAAWIATPGAYLESRENLRFVEWSHTFIQRAAGCGMGHVVALGTCVEYSITGEVLSEKSTPLAPLSTYARCKDALRRRLEEEGKKMGFALCWGRVFYPYGPGEHPARLCSAAVHYLRRHEPFVMEHPDSVRDFIFIEDLARAILLAAECGFHGALNLGTGEGVTVAALGRAVGERLGRPDLIRTIESPVQDPFGFVVADARRLCELGWRPAVGLSEGVERLVRVLYL